MARVANRFTNPRLGTIYDWPLNHDTEEGMEKRRNIEHSAPTGQGSDASVGLIKQQGDDSPMLIKLGGKILDRDQHVAFLAWWKLCQTQTIYFRDFASNEYEVLITAYSPQRQRVVRNTRGGTDLATEAPQNTWAYTLEMEVVRVISGDYLGIPV